MKPSTRNRATQKRTALALLEQAERFAAAGQGLEAERYFNRAIKADGSSSAALVQAGNFYFKQHQPQHAIPLFNRVTQIDPTNAIAWRNLGVGHSAAGEVENAINAFARAVELQPNYGAAHHALALSLMTAGRSLEAIGRFQEVIRLNPHDTDALYNLGNALVLIGEFSAAETAFQVALAHQPNFANAHCNLGKLYYSRNQIVLAREHLKRAVELAPQSAVAHKNLGAVLQHEGKLSEALWFYEAAIERQPDFAEVIGNIGSVRLALGDSVSAAASYRRSLQINPNNAAIFSDMLFCLQNDYSLSNADLFAAHREFAAQFEAPQRYRWPNHTNTPDPQRRLRIGYVSGDLRSHAVAFFLEPILAQRNHAAFEVHLYANHAQVDEVTKRLQRYADTWTPCSHLADDVLAQKIQADGVDILVDLSGHTAYNRLPMFAKKPAPIQVTYIGYGGTTGLEAMDYRITDTALDPIGLTESWNTEELIRLPSGGAAFEGVESAPEPGPLPALAGDGIVLACLNNPRKICAPVIALWSRILLARRDTLLLLGSTSDESLISSLLAQFQAAGVNPSRIVFVPWMPMSDYLALHQKIDLALDPFPYNGGTTSFHSLWMGVPFVTLEGDRTMSRCGMSILTFAELGDWATATEEAYVQKVLTALDDLPALDNLRQSLSRRLRANCKNRSRQITSALESAYRDMWRTWCARPQDARR